MTSEGKFGMQEAVWLTATTISSKVFFSSPSVIASILGNTGWYMTLISAAAAMIGFSFVFALLKRFPGKELTEAFYLSMGKAAGFAFSFILGVYMLVLAVLNISEFHEVLKVYVFPRSPDWYVVVIFAACVLSVSLLGLETIARIAKIIAFFAVTGIISILLLNIENYETSNLFPIFGFGLDKTIVNGVTRCSAYGEVIILAVFADSLQGTKHVKKAGFIALILSALFISSAIFAFTLSFPYYTSQEITAPMYEMATLIDYGRFIQRIEPIFLFIWITTILLSVTAIFYAFVHIFCKIFKIKDKKPVIIAGCAIMFTASFMHRDITSIVYGGIQATRTYGSIPLFILPLIALIAAGIRKKGGKNVA